MSCEIADRTGYRAPNGSFVALPRQQLYAVPSAPQSSALYGTEWHPLNSPNPNIVGMPALKYGVLIASDATGAWSVTLPSATTETAPAAPPMRWILQFPDMSVLTGVVPAAAGPLSIKDLIETHGWTWSTGVYVAPVTSGTFAKGTAVFSGGSATATILFAGGAFGSNAYQITLSPSVDAVDGSIPRPGWSAKSTTGFTLHVDSADFVGSVDWEAYL